jgi:hypothetical protein
MSPVALVVTARATIPFGGENPEIASLARTS